MVVAKFQHENLDLQFSDSDVVNPEDYDDDKGGPTPFFLHDAGFCLAVCFADCLQDAIDIAVDGDKLERFAVDFSENDPLADWRDYGETPDEATENDRISWLGNCCLPYDIETVGAIELTTPAFSLAALFNAQ